MSAATAKVIDFQAYRSARLAQQTTPQATAAPSMTFAPMPMAWFPVWFMPVFFVGVGQPAA